MLMARPRNGRAFGQTLLEPRPWAAEQKVVLIDSWGWLEESLQKQGRQLFGKAKLAKKELTSLLGVVFLDNPRDMLPAQVQWLARGTEEPTSAYLPNVCSIGLGYARVANWRLHHQRP